MSDPQGESLPSYRPSVFYFRKALRGTDDVAELRELGLMLCTAYELEREWIRSQGLQPPKQIMLEEEVREKGWDVEGVGEEDPNQIRFPFPP